MSAKYSMSTKRHLDLSTFDGRLLNGLDFCRKVYDLLDQVRGEPDGIAKLRLRPTRKEKRLIEELIPIARYVQARYREGRRIKVRWLSGSQRYDAILLSSGALVEHAGTGAGSGWLAAQRASGTAGRASACRS